MNGHGAKRGSRRWARRVVRALAGLLIGIVALLVLASIAIHLPWVRARVARELSERISDPIAGRIEITRIGRIGFGSVSGIDAELYDPSERRVAALADGSAQLDLWVLLRSLIGREAVTLDFERVAMESLDVRLIENPSGELSIAGAFEPVEPQPTDRGAEAEGQPLNLSFESVSVEAAQVAYEPADGAELGLRLEQLEGSAQKEKRELRFELRRVDLRAAEVPVVHEVEARLSASGRLDLQASDDRLRGLLLEAQVRGAAAETPFELRAVHDGGKLIGYVDIDATPRSLERLWPDAAVSDAVHLYVGFDGTVEKMQLLCVLQSSGGDLYARGHLGLAPYLSGDLSLVGLHLDASHWLAGAPETGVQLAAELRFTLESGALSARAAVRTWDSRWNVLELPPLALSARVEQNALTASARLELPGGRLEVHAGVPALEPPKETDRRLLVELSANIADLARVTRALRARAELDGRGRLDGFVDIVLGAQPRIDDSQLKASFRALSTASVMLERGSVTASARGALPSLQLALAVDARDLSIPHYPLQSVSLRAHGGLTRLRVSAEIDPPRAAPARLQASIFPGEKTARDIALAFDDDGSGAGMDISAERLTLTSSGIELQNLVVAGPGRLELDASTSGRGVRAEGRSERFSPAALARRLGLELDIPSGVASLEFRADYSPRRISGSLQGDITDVSVAGTTGRAHADLSIDHDVATGHLDVCVPSVVEVRLDASSFRLPAGVSREALARVSGQLEADVHADLAQLGELDVARAFSLPDRGELLANLRVASDAGSLPELRVALATHGLEWPLLQQSVSTAGAARGTGALDVELTGAITSSHIQMTAAVLDSRNEPIAELEAAARAGLEQLWLRPRTLDVRELPIDVELRVADRELEELPLLPRLDGLRGRASARVTATGTLGRPDLTARLSLTRLQLEGSKHPPLAVTADAKLEGKRLRAEAVVSSEREKLLSLNADAEVSGGGQPPRLERLDLDLRSNGLPLAPFGALAGQHLGGNLYGSVRLANMTAAPELQGTLWVNDLQLDGYRQRQARWTVAADTASFRTRLELLQARGRAQLTASGPWQRRVLSAPELQPELARIRLEADGFALGGLQALMPEQIRSLRGRLDASLVIDPAQAGQSRGYVKLRDGGAYVSALGQEFRDVNLEAELRPGGMVSIDELRARALEGRLSATGNARLDGLAFRSAELAVQIPRGDPMPVMLEGVAMADAWGNLEVRAELEPAAQSRRLDIQVRVPRLQINLPEQAPPDVQKLEADPTVAVGTYLPGGDFVSLPLPPYEAREGEGTGAARTRPLPIRMEVVLGDRVWLERGTQLEVKLAGRVVFDVAEELVARGEVRIERGQIDVQGRIFEIENGVITFLEEREPSNPTVVATARYTAPEGTRVYAEFVGPVETGKLSLRSEPPLRDDQILSLLLFGTPEGNFGTSSGEGSVSGAALAAGGSVVTRGLNQELRRLTSLDIQTRIGEREGEPQPEVVVQISPRLTAELAYSLATPTPGRAQDRTYLTLDLRLFRNWSLSTTIGDAGSLLLDLLWRLRY